MRVFTSAFSASLMEAQNQGISPIWFFYLEAKTLTTGAVVPFGFWSGDETVSVSVEKPDGSLGVRSYTGNVNLDIQDLEYVADLTDNAVAVHLSQLAPQVQLAVRGHDVRFAYCEIHATTWNGGVFTSTPQLLWIGTLDEAPISTPDMDNDGAITLSVRSEIMGQLSMMNPAKSSDEHQKRRRANDNFCKYSGTIQTRKIQWYKGD